MYQQQGRPIPADWALDRTGQPTTDAAVALEGLLQPIGQFKGTGLAMIMGMLSSLLSGAAYGTDLGSMETGPKPGQDGHFVAAIRIEAFEDVGRFKRRVDQAIRQLHACRRAPGFDRVYAPGELEHHSREKYHREGIPLNRVTLDDVRAVARRQGARQQYGWLR
ncbi:MAG: hypothetical protein CL878_04035 [Dehalococcoidia bacterium]|nr:hypothetical protein [Dehalococcoidia bacterium]